MKIRLKVAKQFFNLPVFGGRQHLQAQFLQQRQFMQQKLTKNTANMRTPMTKNTAQGTKIGISDFK